MSNQYQELKSSTTLVCCGSAPAAGRTNGHGALKEGSGIRLHALAESPAGGAGRGSPGQAGDRAGPNHTACGSRRKRRVRPGRSVPAEGVWDTHSGGKHRGLSAAGRTGWLSGRSCKGDGMRCWEISGGLRPSTSSVIIQICERGSNNYYSIVQGIEQPKALVWLSTRQSILAEYSDQKPPVFNRKNPHPQRYWKELIL